MICISSFVLCVQPELPSCAFHDRKAVVAANPGGCVGHLMAQRVNSMRTAAMQRKIYVLSRMRLWGLCSRDVWGNLRNAVARVHTIVFTRVVLLIWRLILSQQKATSVKCIIWIGEPTWPRLLDNLACHCQSYQQHQLQRPGGLAISSSSSITTTTRVPSNWRKVIGIGGKFLAIGGKA